MSCRFCGDRPSHCGHEDSWDYMCERAKEAEALLFEFAPLVKSAMKQQSEGGVTHVDFETSDKIYNLLRSVEKMKKEREESI